MWGGCVCMWCVHVGCVRVVCVRVWGGVRCLRAAVTLLDAPFLPYWNVLGFTSQMGAPPAAAPVSESRGGVPGWRGGEKTAFPSSDLCPHPAVSFALALNCFAVFSEQGQPLLEPGVVIKPRKFSVDMILLSNQHSVFQFCQLSSSLPGSDVFLGGDLFHNLLLQLVVMSPYSKTAPQAFFVFLDVLERYRQILLQNWVSDVSLMFDSGGAFLEGRPQC